TQPLMQRPGLRSLRRFQARTQLGIAPRSGKEPVTQHLQIEPGTADEQHLPAARFDVGNRGDGELAVARAVERLIRIDDVVEMMRCPRALGETRLRTPDVEPAVDLARIGVDDLRADALGDIDRDLALAGSRRADDGGDHLATPLRTG